MRLLLPFERSRLDILLRVKFADRLQGAQRPHARHLLAPGAQPAPARRPHERRSDPVPGERDRRRPPARHPRRSGRGAGRLTARGLSESSARDPPGRPRAIDLGRPGRPRREARRTSGGRWTRARLAGDRARRSRAASGPARGPPAKTSRPRATRRPAPPARNRTRSRPARAGARAARRASSALPYRRAYTDAASPVRSERARMTTTITSPPTCVCSATSTSRARKKYALKATYETMGNATTAAMIRAGQGQARPGLRVHRHRAGDPLPGLRGGQELLGVEARPAGRRGAIAHLLGALADPPREPVRGPPHAEAQGASRPARPPRGPPTRRGGRARKRPAPPYPRAPAAPRRARSPTAGARCAGARRPRARSPPAPRALPRPAPTRAAPRSAGGSTLRPRPSRHPTTAASETFTG